MVGNNFLTCCYSILFHLLIVFCELSAFVEELNVMCVGGIYINAKIVQSVKDLLRVVSVKSGDLGNGKVNCRVYKFQMTADSICVLEFPFSEASIKAFPSLDLYSSCIGNLNALPEASNYNIAEKRNTFSFNILRELERHQEIKDTTYN